MSELSEIFHGFSPEEERPPRQHRLKPKVNNNIGPGPIESYGLHIEQALSELPIERREAPSKEEIDMLRAAGYLPIGWKRGEDVLMIHPQHSEVMIYNPETKRYEKINE